MANDKESFDRPYGARNYDHAISKLRKLAEESSTFADFRAKLTSFRKWYLGDPTVEEFKTWTWADYEKLFNEVKGI